MQRRGAAQIHDGHRIRQAQLRRVHSRFFAQIASGVDALALEIRRPIVLAFEPHPVFTDRHDVAKQLAGLLLVDRRHFGRIENGRELPFAEHFMAGFNRMEAIRVTFAPKSEFFSDSLEFVHSGTWRQTNQS